VKFNVTEDQIETIIFGPMFSANEELVKKMEALLGYYGTLRRADMKRITFSDVFRICDC